MTGNDLIPAFSDEQIVSARTQLASHGHVRLHAPFSPAAAQALYHHLDSELEWWRVLNRGEKLWDLGPESLAELDGEKGRALADAVYAGARDGFQFYFDNVRCSDDPGERQQRGLLLDKLLDALNSPAALRLFCSVLADETIERVDGQATRYLPGHFLTAHDDAVAGKNRVAAYVINLTPEWQTDWGGLLQFHDDFGDITHALRPCFNAIHIFKVPALHSVSLVAPFAKAPRYAITGWLHRAG